jgi:hypothetical protein
MAVAGLMVLARPDGAIAGVCIADGTASAAFGAATARGSARFLEAASHAWRAFAALDEGTPAEQHFGEARRLLDDTINRYREALARTEDVAQTDGFLKDRAFDRLQAIFGLSPGSLEQRRWLTLAKTARESKTPTEDLLRVCVSGAETLKSSTYTTRETQAAQRRRAEAQWHLILMHGALVSDALDGSAR